MELINEFHIKFAKYLDASEGHQQYRIKFYLIDLRANFRKTKFLHYNLYKLESEDINLHTQKK